MKQINYKSDDFKQFLNDYCNTVSFKQFLDTWFPPIK